MLGPLPHLTNLDYGMDISRNIKAAVKIIILYLADLFSGDFLSLRYCPTKRADIGTYVTVRNVKPVRGVKTLFVERPPSPTLVGHLKYHSNIFQISYFSDDTGTVEIESLGTSGDRSRYFKISRYYLDFLSLPTSSISNISICCGEKYDFEEHG